jgi:flagellar basal-body rod protein FlgC
MISAAGMRAQSARMRVIAENLANADSLARTPGGDPYRRKMVTFTSELDRATGMNHVAVGKIVEDKSDFELRFDPAHPGANEDGYVKTPNVKSLVEMMDMREAQRSYEANSHVIRAVKIMLRTATEILRN